MGKQYERMERNATPYVLIDWYLLPVAGSLRSCAIGASHVSFRHEHTIADSNVTRSTHFGNIKSFEFSFRIRAKSNSQIDRLEHDKSENTDRDEVGRYADTLRNKLR